MRKSRDRRSARHPAVRIGRFEGRTDPRYSQRI